MLRLSENVRLPFDKLMVLSKVEGLTVLSESRKAALPSSLVTAADFCTLHSSGFRRPCIWAFSVSLREKGFSTASLEHFRRKYVHHFQFLGSCG